MTCPQCSAEVPADNSFCEECGQRLGAPVAVAGACVCGGTGVDADGFCEACGRRVRRPAEDHIEIVVSAQLAGVSDRGVRHDRNEDRLALGESAGAQVLVVCDGVSATRQSERASAAVAAAVLAGLIVGEEDAEGRMRRALAGAAARLAENGEKGAEAPSTTVVAALVEAEVATIGWAGDSRAYWIDGDGARQLTADHSWLNDVVSAHMLTAEEAVQDARAHAITRWFGADVSSNDGGEAMEAEIVRFALPGAGLLMLCSDGLWNYADTGERMAEVVAEVSGDALAMANGLVEFAIGKGGRDNITVAILQIGSKSASGE